MSAEREEHWERIYRTIAPAELSWYQGEARRSVALISRAAPDHSAPVIDVGGGSSTLVDGLLAAGYQDVTVLDLSPTALACARERLGPAVGGVNWLVADVLDAELPAGAWSVWHDRAVFHFLTDPNDRGRYVAQVRRAVRPGGHILLAAFALEGPTRCSGLEVVRYSPETLLAELGTGFTPLGSEREEHRTPSGATQAFIYCLFRLDPI